MAPGELLREIPSAAGPGGATCCSSSRSTQWCTPGAPSRPRAFFARCCPLLLEVGAIAYWSMDLRQSPRRPARPSEAVSAVRAARGPAQRVRRQGRGPRRRGREARCCTGAARRTAGALRGRDRRATSRPRCARCGAPRTQPARARRAGGRDVERDLAGRAGRARACRSRRSCASAPALGVTLDDLLDGEEPAPYRIGRRPATRGARPERAGTLLGGIRLRRADRPRAPGRARARRAAGAPGRGGHRGRLARPRADPGRRPDAGDPRRRGAGRRLRARSTAGATWATARPCSSGSCRAAPRDASAPAARMASGTRQARQRRRQRRHGRPLVRGSRRQRR